MTYAKAGPEVKNEAFAVLGELKNLRKFEGDSPKAANKPKAKKVKSEKKPVEAAKTPAVQPAPASVSATQEEAHVEAKAETLAAPAPASPSSDTEAKKDDSKPHKGGRDHRRRRGFRSPFKPFKESAPHERKKMDAELVVPEFRAKEAAPKPKPKQKRPEGTLSLGFVLSPKLSAILLAHRIVSGELGDATEGNAHFVVYRRRSEDGGFDHVRVNVIVKRDREKPCAAFAVSEATGSYDALAAHIGEEINFDELLRRKPSASEATKLLCGVLAEAVTALRAAFERRMMKTAA